MTQCVTRHFDGQLIRANSKTVYSHGSQHIEDMMEPTGSCQCLTRFKQIESRRSSYWSVQQPIAIFLTLTFFTFFFLFLIFDTSTFFFRLVNSTCCCAPAHSSSWPAGWRGRLWTEKRKSHLWSGKRKSRLRLPQLLAGGSPRWLSSTAAAARRNMRRGERPRVSKCCKVHIILCLVKTNNI